MAESIPNTLLSSLSEFVTAQMGLHFPRERWRDLERGIRSAAREFDFQDAGACIEWLVSSPLTQGQIEVLASHLTVGETYFFREKKTFEILEEQVLPGLIRSRRDADRRLRIWSAACSTGEEPYSLAILLSKMIPDLADWNVTILATDINPRFLRKAAEGRYSAWSFRDSPPWLRPGYFNNAKADTLEVVPNVRGMVTLAYLNLVEDVYPSLVNNTNAMDIIFCRNVLMYFAPDQARGAVQKLHRCLVEGGWLVVSPCEASHVLFSSFSFVNFPGVMIYRKAGVRTESVEAVEARPLVQPEFTFSPTIQALDELPARAGPVEGLLSESQSEVKRPITPEPLPDPSRIAWRLYERGFYTEAEKVILALLSESSDDASSMALLARVYANQGRLNEADEWCEKAIVADKMNPCSHFLRATILQEQGLLEDARVSLTRAIYLDQNFVLAHYALGNLARQQGKSPESRKHFENTLSLLSRYRPDQVLPESEGITAGRLTEIITVQKVHREEIQGAIPRERNLAPNGRNGSP